MDITTWIEEMRLKTEEMLKVLAEHGYSVKSLEPTGYEVAVNGGLIYSRLTWLELANLYQFVTRTPAQTV